MRWVRLLAACLFVAGCSGSSSPATTPATGATTSSTTTTAEVTTTLDRLSEIEAIYQDLEERRLDALYRGDREAFAALYANDGYLEESLELFELVEFDVEPVVEVSVVGIVHDGPECIAAQNVVQRPDKGTTSEPTIEVLEFRGGVWLISFVGTGWACEGPHPFDS